MATSDRWVLGFLIVVPFALGVAQLSSPKPASDARDRVFTQRLKTIGGGLATDCGTTSPSEPDDSVAKCGLNAFHDRKAFFLGYYTLDGGVFDFAYGLAGDSSGSIFAVNYSLRAFPAVAPNGHTQLMDDNHTRVIERLRPVTLDKTRRGLLACITPVNQEESDKAAHQTPLDTTVCAVLENPAYFRNRLVRLRGHFSGNFEYSTLSGDGCQGALWFEYGGGDGPPTLSAFVRGEGRAGLEDPQGRLILPVPVEVVRDSKLELFEKQTAAMTKADDDYTKEHPNQYASHCVTATFVGRIDAVSPEVHEFRKKQKDREHSDSLGFGQMGIYEAQLIMQSVTDNATLNLCGE